MKLSEIALKTDCQMIGDQDVEIIRVAGIDEAGLGDLTFVSNRKYISHIKNTKASAIILGEDMPSVEIPNLRTKDPYMAFARALELFYDPPRLESGIHPTAVIAEGVEYREQLDYLLRNGCQKIQGFIYSPPVNANQFE